MFICISLIDERSKNTKDTEVIFMQMKTGVEQSVYAILITEYVTG